MLIRKLLHLALLRLTEIRAFNAEERNLKMKELRDELMRERGVAAMGGAPTTMTSAD